MRNDWKSVTLGDLIEVKHGFAFDGEFIQDDPAEDVLLTPGNFSVGGGFKGEKFKYYKGPVPPGYVLQAGDLLVTMTDLSKQSDTLGLPALVPFHRPDLRFLHNQRLGKVVIKDSSNLDSRYLHYLLCGRAYRNEVLASATGTTVKHTSPNRIRRFEFLLPPFAEQVAIGHILRALDDKIELNRRMSETLEAMARVLFKSWFVDFDPVRAKAEGRETELPDALAALFPDSLIDTERWVAPAGWPIAGLNEVFDINPPRPLRKDEPAPYLDMANMPTQGHTPNEVSVRPFGSGMRFQNGDTLVARITPCLENGKTAFVDFLEAGQVGWGSTEYIVLRPKSPIPVEFAYCLARDPGFRDFAIQSMTGTSGRQRVPVEALSHYRLSVPPQPVADSFGRIVRPIFHRASVAAKETRTLAALRDALLPKLLSGKIRVNPRS